MDYAGSSYDNSVFYNLPNLKLCLILYCIFLVCSKHITQYPIFFQSTNDMLYHNPFFRMLIIEFISSCDSPILFLFFLFGMDDVYLGKSFSTPTRYPRSNILTTCFGVKE